MPSTLHCVLLFGKYRLLLALADENSVQTALKQAKKASSPLGMGSHDYPLLGKPCLPNSSCFLVRLTTRRFFVPA